MAGIAIKRFNIGQTITDVQIDARGNHWLLYWLLGEDEAFCYMTDGVVYVEVAHVHEWQSAYVEALAITRDRRQATDLTCLRIKRSMQLRGAWKPVR